MEREPGDPTPAQIAKRAAAIRASWSEAERQKRRDAVPRFGQRDWQLVEQSEQARRAKAKANQSCGQGGVLLPQKSAEAIETRQEVAKSRRVG